MIVLLISVAAAAFFLCGIEAALASVNRVRLRCRAISGAAEARRMEQLLRHPGRLLASVAALHAVLRVVALTLFYEILRRETGPQAAVWATIGSLPLWALLLEVLPKAVFRTFPYKKLLPFAWLLHSLGSVVAPLARLADTWAAGRLHVEGWRRIGIPDLRAAINRSAESGAITPLQKHMLHSILTAHDTPADAEAVSLDPRAAASAETPVHELRERALQTGREEFFIVPSAGNGAAQTHSEPGVVKVGDLVFEGAGQGHAQAYMKRAPQIPAKLSVLEALLLLRAWEAEAALLKESHPPRTVTARALAARLLLGPSHPA